MFAEDISENFSEDRRYHFYWILEYFLMYSESSRKIAFSDRFSDVVTLRGFTLSPFPDQQFMV